MAHCFSCGTVLDDRMEVYRSTQCPGCGKDVRVCKNCTFYEPGAHWDCRETIPEAVRDKERANFCDYFKLRPGTTSDGRSGENPGANNSGAAADKARDAFNGLFGG